jgi:hypothetical protein
VLEALSGDADTDAHFRQLELRQIAKIFFREGCGMSFKNNRERREDQVVRETLALAEVFQ